MNVRPALGIVLCLCLCTSRLYSATEEDRLSNPRDLFVDRFFEARLSISWTGSSRRR